MSLFKEKTDIEEKISEKSNRIINIWVEAIKSINPHTYEIPYFVESGRYYKKTELFEGLVVINLIEDVDPYDDFEPEEYTIRISSNLYESEDIEGIAKVVDGLYKDILELEAQKSFDDKWLPILHYTIAEIELYLNVVRPYLYDDNQHFHWVNKPELYESLKLELAGGTK